MIKTIYKYTVHVDALTVGATTVVRIPKGARLLHVDSQGMSFAMWCEVEPANEVDERKFQIFMTGQQVGSHLNYTGTGDFSSPDEPLILHLYEVFQEGISVLNRVRN